MVSELGYFSSQASNVKDCKENNLLHDYVNERCYRRKTTTVPDWKEGTVTVSHQLLGSLILPLSRSKLLKTPSKRQISAARLRRDPPKRQVSRCRGVGFLSFAFRKVSRSQPWFPPYSPLQYLRPCTNLGRTHTLTFCPCASNRGKVVMADAEMRSRVGRLFHLSSFSGIHAQCHSVDSQP